MSRSDVVRRLRALSSRGVPISVRYLLPVHADLVGQALAIFGSFDRARAVAGLDVPVLEHDPDVIIGALRSLARSGVRLDAATLSTMGESALVSACVDTFGSLAAAAARAGIAAAPEPRRPSPAGPAPTGFAQPPISPDGQVSTSLALEILQKTALQLGKVPAARDLPPDVARRLTTDYGSVRFAYLALRIHAEGEAHQSQSAESAATAAAEPVQVVSQEALAATARMSENAGAHRRQFDAAREAAASPKREEPGDDDEDDAGPVDFEAAWEEVERAIEDAAAEARARLRQHIGAALQRFVNDATETARRQTIVALEVDGEDLPPPAGDDEEQ